jgi:broad specificity phosphatase PhoE
MPALYLIRHAEPATTGVLLGQSDPPLSEAGRQQAAALRLPEPCAVYTSPLRRAVETAAYLAEDAIVVPNLAEITYGDWDGLSWAEIERRWPKVARRKLADWEGVTPPGGEAFTDFRTRITEAFASIQKTSGPCAIVGHEAVNAVILCLLGNWDFLSHRQAYCELQRHEF